MSPLAVFFRTLSRSSAICLGIALVVVNPSLEWSSSRSVTAQKSPAEAAVDGLITVLKDNDAGVRRQAAMALGQLRNARAVPPLIDALKDEEPEVRLRAIVALGELDDSRATPALAQALKDPDARVRSRAAIALGVVGDRTAVEPLVALVRDASVEVRRRAVIALGEIGDPAAMPAVTAALKDDDAGVRRAAIHALAELAGGSSASSRPNASPNPMPNPRPTPNPRFNLTWGSAPHPGSVARGAPTPRAAPSQARRARLARDAARGNRAQDSRGEPHNGLNPRAAAPAIFNGGR